MSRTSDAMSSQDAYNQNTIKILLATDNHIGYLERDPVRGRDSFDTFEEILQLAVKHGVDFILLAGDLFHENRPSRDCIYRVIALLREYTLGDKPVQIELLSDPEEGKGVKVKRFPAVNYEDPNFNIGIPVFSIHGNHDDPQGAGPEGALCALDLLSVTGLLNYMGKTDLPTTDAEAQSTGLAIRPVLLRKGSTKLGLYGIGNVRDARMHFELRSNRVRMYMPKDKEEWFNILLLHQNRVKRGPQESVPEGMFDDSINLVVWGHEHDCRIVPEPVAGKEYYITQPGSSVATSLADGEALEKHVALLQIQGKEFRMEPIPLRTVRPFVIDDVVLAEAAEEENFDVTDQIAVGKYLRTKIDELINKANAEWEGKNARASENGEETLPSMLPLIRLKVDTTDVPEMSNPIRFGQEFQGRIANPRDVLLFHRSKKLSTRSKAKRTVDDPELSIDDPDIPISERLAKVRVESLVREYLSSQEMQLLGELGMGDAIQTFVEKDDPHAISAYVNMSLKSLMKGIQTNGQVEEDQLDAAVQKARREHESQYKARMEGGKAKDDKERNREETSDQESLDSMEIDHDQYEEVSIKKTSRPVTVKSTNRTRGKSTVKSTNQALRSGNNASDEDDVRSEEESLIPKKKTNRAIILNGPATRGASTKGSSRAKSQSKQATLSFAPSATASRTSRAAASNAKRKSQRVVEIESDDE